MSYLGIYLWTRLDVVLGVFIVASIITGFITLVSGVAYAVEYSDYGPHTDDAHKFMKIFKNILCVFLLVLSVVILVPNKKDAALIYVVPTLAKSETIQEVAKATPEITKLGLDVLKETLEGLKKGNGNEQENNSSVK